MSPVIFLMSLRRRLSAASTLFDMDFQHFDPRHDSFGYTCLVLEVKERGVLDSLGLWFNLYLDQDKTLVLSNAPKTFLSPPASGAAAATSCAAPEGMDESGEEECQRKKVSTAFTPLQSPTSTSFHIFLSSTSSAIIPSLPASSGPVVLLDAGSLSPPLRPARSSWGLS